MPPRKKKSLVIVESPAKAKTINKYLGREFEVAASKGHVRDLPKSKFGIDIEEGWVPTYRNLRDRKDVIDSLKKQAGKAEFVYLAPDPDREGEAIAWHLKEALGLKDEKVRRVTFNEITKRAVAAAFETPGEIDDDRVRAQETRRFLDRVVGYQLSPLLWRKVRRGLSAGRVQSVAVRMIVEREKEIRAFKEEEYWRIAAILGEEGLKAKIGKLERKKKAKGRKSPTVEDDENPPEEELEVIVPEGALRAELAEWKGKKFAVDNGDDAGKVVDSLKENDFVITKIEQKDRSEKAHPPFITSTLQQQAALRLRFSAKQTMMTAQRLYEGVELGSDGSVALITYMRTDSFRVSADALKECREKIKNEFGDKYLPKSANTYASRKSAQEGHEAVRPTDLTYTPDKVEQYLPPDQFKLYKLIYNRFVASQMTPALFGITNVEVTAGDGLFKSQGKILKFDGYRRVYAPAGKQEDSLLPNLAQDQKLDCLEILPTQHFTQPPARFNEASLVRALEKEGIGRPSTYASIIGSIQKRDYVEQKERRFHATELGILVTDLLVDHFPKIMDLKFTSHMEDELDQIESSHLDWKGVLNEFYEPFSQSLKLAETKMPAVKGEETDEKCPQCESALVTRWSKRGQFLGCSNYPECKYIKPQEGDEENAPQPTEHSCPDCGKPLVQRMGRRGPFLSCSGYPDCKTTMNITDEGTPVPSVTKTEHKCEKCGEPMVIREGRRGPFLACSGYPKCKNAKDVDKNGNPIQPIDTGVNCDKCKGPMVIRRGPRGPFLGCGAYPKCRSIKKIPDELKEKVEAMYPSPPKKDGPEVEIEDTCPDCGAKMKLRTSRRGPFLGCSKYPKCKGTMEASPAVLEKIEAAS